MTLAEEYAAVNVPATIPEESGVLVLKHDPQPAELAEEYTANE